MNPDPSSTTKKENEKVKVIDTLWVFLTATAFLGPFALPLLWRNPRYSRNTKIVASAFIILLTLGLIYLMKVVLVEFVNAMKTFEPTSQR